MSIESQAMRPADNSNATAPIDWDHSSLQRSPQPVDRSQGPKPADKHLPDLALTEQKGNTTVTKDGSGTAKEYSNTDYTLKKHDDGDWYFNQKDSKTFVKVDGNSIKMDDQGKVTYNESGLFGKDNQTLGNGSTGFMSSIESAGSHLAHAVVDHPLDTFNTLAFSGVAAVDAIAGTHGIKAIGDLEKGAANEVVHHPLAILKDVGIGAAIAAATVVAGPVGGIALAGGLFAASEVAKNHDKDGWNPISETKDAFKDAVNGVKGMAGSAEGWAKDTAIVAGNGNHSAAEVAAADKGLQGAGAFLADTAAGVAGGLAGGFATGAAIDAAKGALARSAEAAAAAQATTAAAEVTNAAAKAANLGLSDVPGRVTVTPSGNGDVNVFLYGKNSGYDDYTIRKNGNIEWRNDGPRGGDSPNATNPFVFKPGDANYEEVKNSITSQVKDAQVEHSTESN